MKKLIEKFVLILVVNLSFFFYNKVIIKVDLEWSTYISIICISIPVILLLKKESIHRKIYLFGAIFFSLILGVISVLLAFVLFGLSEKYLMLEQSLYTILKGTSNANEAHTSINTITFLTLLTLGLSLAIFSLFIILFKKFLGLLNYRLRSETSKFANYYNSNTQIISMYIGLLLVMFGFFPLLLDMLNLGGRDLKDVEEEFKKGLFTWILVCFVPYAYFLLKDSNIDNDFSSTSTTEPLNITKAVVKEQEARLLKEDVSSMFKIVFIGALLLINFSLIMFVLVNGLSIEKILINEKIFGLGDSFWGALSGALITGFLAIMISNREQNKRAKEKEDEKLKVLLNLKEYANDLLSETKKVEGANIEIEKVPGIYAEFKVSFNEEGNQESENYPSDYEIKRYEIEKAPHVRNLLKSYNKILDLLEEIKMVDVKELDLDMHKKYLAFKQQSRKVIEPSLTIATLMKSDTISSKEFKGIQDIITDFHDTVS